MFSPHYAAARRRGPADPENFCAINVVLHGSPRRWTMTERGRQQLRRSQHTLRIGPSHLHWDGQALQIQLDEVSCPLPFKVRGSIRFTPTLEPHSSYALDEAARHVWTPLAPRGRIEVALTHPALQWSGQGYLDHNHGLEPLEAAFHSWHWSRTAVGDGAELRYEVIRHQGKPLNLALHVAHDGSVHSMPDGVVTTLPRSAWRIARSTRAVDHEVISLADTLLDAPFYARSLLHTHRQGQCLSTVHESLSLQRFSNPWVQAMLRFRIPRSLR